MYKSIKCYRSEYNRYGNSASTRLRAHVDSICRCRKKKEIRPRGWRHRDTHVDRKLYTHIVYSVVSFLHRILWHLARLRVIIKRHCLSLFLFIFHFILCNSLLAHDSNIFHAACTFGFHFLEKNVTVCFIYIIVTFIVYLSSITIDVSVNLTQM